MSLERWQKRNYVTEVSELLFYFYQHLERVML